MIDIEGIYKDEIKTIDAMSANNDQLLVDEYGLFIPTRQPNPLPETSSLTGDNNPCFKFGPESYVC